jgi:DNA-directed RNA polymerase alpha subunit
VSISLKTQTAIRPCLASFHCSKETCQALAKLMLMSEDDLMKVRNLGRKSFEEVVRKLNELMVGEHKSIVYTYPA